MGHVGVIEGLGEEGGSVVSGLGDFGGILDAGAGVGRLGSCKWKLMVLFGFFACTGVHSLWFLLALVC